MITLEKATRKAVRQAVKALYEDAYGMASELSGNDATNALEATNEALRVLNDELGLNIKVQEF